jgi:hypothetical protein
MTKSKSITINTLITQISKKLVSKTISKSKLLQIAQILNISVAEPKPKTKKTAVKVDTSYLQKITDGLKRDDQLDFIDEAEGKHLIDEIDLMKDKAYVRSLSKKAPKRKVITQTKTKKKMVEPKPKPKPTTLKYTDFVKDYAQKHNLKYHAAMKQIKETGAYVKPEKQKKQKKTNQSTEHQCPMCKFKTLYKSSYERHMRQKHNKKQLFLDIARLRGMTYRYEGRSKSKNKEVRDEAFEKLKEAAELKESILKTMELFQTDNFKHATKKVAPQKKKKVSLPPNLLERLNTTYSIDNDQKLNLRKNHIDTVKRIKDGYRLTLKGFEDPNEDLIDTIEIKEEDQGYEVLFIQNIEYKGEMKESELDSMFVYL